MTTQSPITRLRIIRPYQLAEALDVNPVTIWRMEKRGELPPRKKFSRSCVGWIQSDLEEFFRSRPDAADVAKQQTSDS